MSGSHITQLQVNRYMNSRQAGYTQEQAADKAGISVRSARRIERGQRPEPVPRHWRTRIDPLEDVWQSELVPLLAQEPTLTGITLWEYLNEHYPNRYPESVLRTLQRRIKHWLATEGPDQPVMFRQALPAGHQGLSDFTHPSMPVTIAGTPFKHLLYQFRLAYSGWRSVLIVQGGESYSALADGLQCALHKLGGAPKEHRTDSLSAAYTNNSQKQALADSYEALCRHYAMRPTVNNLGVSHENGAIETAHGSLKRRIEQAIKLRASADFPSIQAYQAFLDRIVDRLNARCKTRLAEEQAHLQRLPAYRFMDYRELSVCVTTSSTIVVKRSLYSVPSRLIGERLRVHLYHNRLECFLGQTRALTLPRVYPATPEGRARRIDYRHIIHSLAAKPQAFRFSRLRDDILPSAQYRRLWILAEQQFPPQEACKWIVTVLRFAADYDCEGSLASELLARAQKDRLPDLKTVQAKYVIKATPPAIPIRQHAVADYDALLSGNWTSQGACAGGRPHG